MGDRSGRCCHGYRVGAAWTIETDSCSHLVQRTLPSGFLV